MNLQNLPKRGSLAKIIRELFIPPQGYKLVHCDYNASELRWVAHVAKEKEMAKIFREGKDPHRITGLEMRNLPENYEFSSEKELKDTRQEAKSLNFGLIYLMTPNGLKKYAKQGYGVELTEREAHEKYEKFFRKFYNIPKWHERDKATLHKYGFLRTVFGRKRNLPKVWSEERKDQMQAERTGINTLIQGPSSDATLLGGYNILKDERVKHDECRINLFIHDALVFEIAQDKIHYYLPIIKHHMENIPTEEFGFRLSVPLVIEAEVGNRLSDLKEMKICKPSI
jgi:DNA polymerase-1